MNQSERRRYLITELLKEDGRYRGITVPADARGQRQLLRGLMNVRMPGEISKEFLEIQDACLQEQAREKGIVKLSELMPMQEHLYLWQGDITRLEAAAESGEPKAAFAVTEGIKRGDDCEWQHTLSFSLKNDRMRVHFRNQIQSVKDPIQRVR